MKLPILTTCLALLLAGCTTTNNFLTVSPTSPPKMLQGYWTGTVGPWLVTMEIKPDGSGLMCESYLKNHLNKIKIDNQTIVLQSGYYYMIKKIAENNLDLSLPGASDYQFISDPNLTNASIYCADMFSKIK